MNNENSWIGNEVMEKQCSEVPRSYGAGGGISTELVIKEEL